MFPDHCTRSLMSRSDVESPAIQRNWLIFHHSLNFMPYQDIHVQLFYCFLTSPGLGILAYISCREESLVITWSVPKLIEKGLGILCCFGDRILYTHRQWCIVGLTGRERHWELASGQYRVYTSGPLVSQQLPWKLSLVHFLYWWS